MELVLFTTHCPKCRVLESKMKAAGIEYRECTDTDELLKKYPEITAVPQLEVHDSNGVTLKDFREANDFLNNLANMKA